MRSRAIVFASIVLLVAPMSLQAHAGRCHRRHAHRAPAAPLAPPAPTPETPLDRLGR